MRGERICRFLPGESACGLACMRAIQRQTGASGGGEIIAQISIDPRRNDVARPHYLMRGDRYPARECLQYDETKRLSP